MVKIHWIAHACFRIETTEGMVIYTDPYQIGKGEPAADLILVSHDHYDHADKKSIKNIWKDDTKLVCPKSCAAGLSKFNAKGLDPGDSIEIDGINITAVPAYNPNKAFHPKNNKWVGYIIETSGKRIYHAGDTDIIPEMENLGTLDVALLPVGDTYTMGFADAAECSKIIQPSIVVPMHDWDKDLNQFKAMVEQVASNVQVEILKGKDLDI
ncbi:MAG: MBL fold metallo-hydrolase [Candidatus Helarchaeota archaeon]